MKKILIHILEFSIGLLFIVLIIGCIKYRNNIWELIKQEREKPATNQITEEAVSIDTDTPIVDETANEVKDTQEEDLKAEEEVETPIEEEPEVKTKLVFTGDVLLTGYLLTQYDTKGIQGILAPDIVEEMNQADLTMVNEEFPFSNRGTAAEDKQFTFRIDPKRVNVLKDLGIDIVALANNHVLDYGQDALVDTFETLENAQIQYVGAGNNHEEAKQRREFELNGMNIGILAASRVIPVPNWAAGSSPGVFTTYDPTNLIAEIKSAKETCDVVIIYVHWGIERDEYPQDYQRELAKKYIDAGADIVIGAHPHVLQGIEYYNEKPIFYSLGNFIFGSQIPKTAYLKMEIDSEKNIALSLEACATDSSYVLNKASNQEEIYQYLTEISTNAVVDQEGNVKPKE
ncbi:CapA family protein [Candidatus Galacturonibacter soehngenii]|uniref:CapA family protein n=1 Tax=Candidatus Galacturonatibacter soehngenii TaxID=2307010 RepID=A0A7V7QJ91_9FIRM|nr:CapA family protein [Candidatus Galacturonibacter soehngenii]KAB1437663.1 CapA family protein [Candidatus Galacturonibacter soehngenii]